MEELRAFNISSKRSDLLHYQRSAWDNIVKLTYWAYVRTSKGIVTLIDHAGWSPLHRTSNNGGMANKDRTHPPSLI